MSDFYEDVASDLHAIADLVGSLAGRDLPKAHFTLTFYPHGDTDAANIAAIDGLGMAVLGKPGAVREMHDGTFHYDLAGLRGIVDIKAFQGIESPEKRALREEAERLRAEVEQLRAERAAMGPPSTEDSVQ